MLSRPASISDETIANVVAVHWLPQISDISYLPWGFGAHHWRASGGGATLFVTLDQLEPRHTRSSLEAAYAGAAALAAAGLDMVCAPLPARSGRFTVDVGTSALSVTPWLQGNSPTEAQAREPQHARQVVLALDALHRAVPPEALRSWTPQVGPSFADELRTRTAEPWTSGPLADKARLALDAHIEPIQRWTERYLDLSETACSRRDTWVPTHGEPHNDNQVVTADGSGWSIGSRWLLHRPNVTTPTWSLWHRTYCGPTPRCWSCSHWTGGSPKSLSTQGGSPLRISAPKTTTPRCKGCTKS